MDDEEWLTPEEIFAKPMPDDMEGYIPTSVIVIVEGVSPETGRRELGFKRTNEAAWSQVGMLETLKADILHVLTQENDD